MLAVEQDLAGVGRVEPVEDVHQRRLARAVLAEQRVHLAATKVEVDVVVRENAWEPLGDRAQLEERGVGHRFARSYPAFAPPLAKSCAAARAPCDRRRAEARIEASDADRAGLRAEDDVAAVEDAAHRLACGETRRDAGKQEVAERERRHVLLVRRRCGCRGAQAAVRHHDDRRAPEAGERGLLAARRRPSATTGAGLRRPARPRGHRGRRRQRVRAPRGRPTRHALRGPVSAAARPAVTPARYAASSSFSTSPARFGACWPFTLAPTSAKWIVGCARATAATAAGLAVCESTTTSGSSAMCDQRLVTRDDPRHVDASAADDADAQPARCGRGSRRGGRRSRRACAPHPLTASTQHRARAPGRIRTTLDARGAGRSARPSAPARAPTRLLDGRSECP